MKNKPLKQKNIPRGYGAPGDGEGKDGDVQIRWVKGSGIFIFYKWLSRWYSSRLSLHKPRSSEKNEPVFLPVNRKSSKLAGELSYDNGKFNIGKGDQKTNQILSVDKSKVADVDSMIMTRTSTTGTDEDSGEPDILFENTGHVHVRLFNPATTAGSSYDLFHSYARLHPETFNVTSWTVGVDVSDQFKMKWGYGTNTSEEGNRKSPDTPSKSAINRMTLTQAGALSTVSTITAGEGFIGKFEDITASRLQFTNIFGVVNPAVNEGSHIHLDQAIQLDDNVTSASGTRVRYDSVMLEALSLRATNASVTTTRASTFTITGPPAAGTNMTLTNAHAMRIQRGSIYVDDTIGEGHDYIVNGNMKFDVSGDLTLDAAGDQINIDNAGTTFGTIDTGTPTKLKIAGTTGYQVILESQGSGDIFLQSGDNITIDATDALVIDTDGSFLMKKDGTEYSVANSAYAGMILGYRMIGEDAGHSSYTLTTSYAVPDSDMTVRFIAPPSGAVEVFVQIYHNASTSNRLLHVGLSDNATYNSIGATYECMQNMPDETNDQTVQHYWTVTGLTPGNTYNYWFGAKTSATTAYLNWGGTGAGRFCDFIMKVTALPTAVSDFAEYD